jgi:hypothetical protein
VFNSAVTNVILPLRETARFFRELVREVLIDMKGKAGEGGEIAQQVLQFEQEVERDIYSITLSLA